MNDLRFTSLRGASRRFIDDWDVDDWDGWDVEARDLDDFVRSTPRNASAAPDGELESEWDLDSAYEDPPHDGWSEIRPLYQQAMREAHITSLGRSS
ncbi:MAG: hypothetical protein AB8I08_06240 [Sandaracinaceae bacterium]